MAARASRESAPVVSTKKSMRGFFLTMASAVGVVTADGGDAAYACDPVEGGVAGRAVCD